MSREQTEPIAFDSWVITGLLVPTFRKALNSSRIIIPTRDILLRMVPLPGWSGLSALRGYSIVDHHETAAPTKRPNTADTSPNFEEAVATLRVVGRIGRARIRHRPSAKSSTIPEWSDEMVAAVARGIGEARSAGRRCVELADLLLGLLGDPANSACLSLRERGVSRDEYVDWLVHQQSQRSCRPWLPVVEDLYMLGSSFPPVEPRWLRLLTLPMKWIVGAGSGFRSPVVLVLKLESARQAVRAGCDLVDTSHILLAILSMDHDLSRANASFPPAIVASNRGSDVLQNAGATFDRLLNAAKSARSDGLETHTTGPGKPRGLTGLEDPMWSDTAMAVMAQSRTRAEALGEREGTSHVLRSLLELGPSAKALLEHAGIAPASIEQALRQSRPE